MLGLAQLIETLGEKIFHKLVDECEAVRLNQGSPIGVAFPFRLPNTQYVKIIYAGIHPWFEYATDTGRCDALFWTFLLENQYHSDISGMFKTLVTEHILNPFAQFAMLNPEWIPEIVNQHMSYDRWRATSTGTHALVVQIMDLPMFVEEMVQNIGSVLSNKEFDNKLVAIDNEHSMYIANTGPEKAEKTLTASDIVGPFLSGVGKIKKISIPYPNLPRQYLQLIRDVIRVLPEDLLKKVSFDTSQKSNLLKAGMFKAKKEFERVYYYPISTGGRGQTFYFVFLGRDDRGELVTTLPTSGMPGMAMNKMIEEINQEHQKQIDDLKKRIELMESSEGASVGYTTTRANTRGGVCAVSARQLLTELKCKDSRDLGALFAEGTDLQQLGDFIIAYTPSTFTEAVRGTQQTSQSSPSNTSNPEMTLMRVVSDLQELYETLDKSLPETLKSQTPVVGMKESIRMALSGANGNQISRFRPRREVVKQIRFEQMARKLLRNLLTKGNDGKSLEHAKEIARVLMVADTNASPEDAAMLRLVLGGEMNS